MAVNFYSDKGEAIDVSSNVQGIDKGRIPVLDGFRGIAVLMVMCYHFIPAISFGWAGVDLFFILSGFLITSILMNTVGSPHYLYVYFFRRILRIVPLYFAVLFVLFVLLPLLLPSFVTPSYHNLVRDQYWYWLFAVNIQYTIQGFPENITTVHFWSLACEMQFYLVWPLLIIKLHNRRQLLFMILIVLFVLALAFRVFTSDHLPFHDIFRYVLLPSRLDAFAAGAILFFVVSKEFSLKRSAWYLIALLTLLLILFLSWKGIYWHFTDSFVQQYGLTLNIIFWFSILAISLQVPNGIIAAIAGNKVLRKAGMYSYGMYVFHLPVGILIEKLPLFSSLGQENGMMMLLKVTMIFVVTVCISLISFHLFEKRMMLLKPRYHVAGN